MDGIGLAMQAGAVLVAVGAVAVLRSLPSHDLVAQPERRQAVPSRSADCLTGHRITQKGYCQERWAYLFDAGALDEAAANALADLVWPFYGDAQ